MKKFVFVTTAVLLTLGVLLACAPRLDADGVNNVAMISANESFDDGSYNELCSNALAAVPDINRHLLSDVDIEDPKKLVASLDSNSADLVLCVDSLLKDMLKAAAASDAKRTYVIFDVEYDEIPDNLCVYTFAVQQSSFLAGYAAACMTGTGKVGFIGGMDMDTINYFRSGYEAGIAYANDVKGTSVTCATAYTGTFNDERAGYDTANAMYNDGADIIFVAAGACGFGAIDAATEALDRYVIGVDEDQSFAAYENVLMSVTKDITPVIGDIVKKAVSGEHLGGRLLTGGLADGAVGVALTGVPDMVAAELDALQRDIISGELTVD